MVNLLTTDHKHQQLHNLNMMKLLSLIVLVHIGKAMDTFSPTPSPTLSRDSMDFEILGEFTTFSPTSDGRRGLVESSSSYSMDFDDFEVGDFTTFSPTSSPTGSPTSFGRRGTNVRGLVDSSSSSSNKPSLCLGTFIGSLILLAFV